MVEVTKQLPLPGEVFEVDGSTAFVIPPVKRRGSGAMPWVWYAPTLANLPNHEEVWMFERFAAAGMAIAGIDVGESFGNPRGRALFTALHGKLVKDRGMSARPALLARSRGGLMLYSWGVEHPECVSCVAGLYPVCTQRSYPGLDKACGAFDMTAAEFEKRLAEHSPLDRLEPLAKARVPVFHIHGDNDVVVPLEDNSAEFARRYARLGGSMTLKVIAGGGHDHSRVWFECQELVDFVIRHGGGIAGGA